VNSALRWPHPPLTEALREVARCLDDEPDSACLLGEDWEFLYVNPAWERFAEENGGHSATTSRLLGQSYLRFAGDPATTQLLQSIQVRVTAGEAFTLATTCDGPQVKRRLASHFLPLWSGNVLATVVLHLVVAPGAAEDRWWGQKDLAAPPGTTCGSCHRLRGGPGWRVDERPDAEGASTCCPTCAGLHRWTGRLVATGARR
jgi:hypothetical protein